VPHADLVARGGLERNGDPWIAADVGQLALSTVQMSGDEFIAIQPHPDDGDLRRPVRVHGHEMSKGTRLDQLPSRSIEDCHAEHHGTGTARKPRSGVLL